MSHYKKAKQDKRETSHYKDLSAEIICFYYGYFIQYANEPLPTVAQYIYYLGLQPRENLNLIQTHMSLVFRYEIIFLMNIPVPKSKEDENDGKTRESKERIEVYLPRYIQLESSIGQS